MAAMAAAAAAAAAALQRRLPARGAALLRAVGPPAPPGRLAGAAAAPGRPLHRAMSGGWHIHGMYGGPSVDPTEGRAKWDTIPEVAKKDREKPIRGALDEKEYDEKHGRWWFVHKEHDRPKLYTSIGRHARRKGLKRTIVRFAYNSPNFKKLLRDKYRKRWPKNDQIGVRFFAEFCLRPFERRPLAETAHTLPLYGVGCKFWRGKTVDTPDTRGQYFMAKSAQFRQRPMRGVLRGTQYLFGRPIKDDVAPMAKSLGSWRHEVPEGAHPAVYRPPFPALLSAPAEASAGEE